MNQALDGVRIIDMTHALAGPSGTQLLADLGADVVKIENPDGGDFTRTGHPWVFQSFNRNKRSVTLDVKRPEGRDLLGRLVASADVFVQSQRPGVVEQLGLGRDELLRINPRLVYATLTGFGPAGPESQRRAVDAVVQAESGLAALQGAVLGNVSVVDETAGLSLAFAILAALHRRERTGHVDHVEVNLLDSAVYLQSAPFAEFSVTGTMREQRDAARRFATVAVFDAADGPFFLAGYWDRDWEAICHVIERPDLVKEERFATSALRLANVDEVHEILAEAFATRPRAELVAELERGVVMAGRFRSYGDVLAGEQFRLNETFESLTISTGDDVTVPRPPYRFVGRPVVGSRPAPVLGSSTDEVLLGLGLADDEIDALRSAGVLGGSIDEAVAS